MRVRLGVGLRHGGARPLLIFPGGEHKGARLATWAAAPVHLLRAKVRVRVRVIVFEAPQPTVGVVVVATDLRTSG